MKINGIIIENKETGYFTAFIKEYPGVLAQGQNLEEVKKKLGIAWKRFLELNDDLNMISFSDPEELHPNNA